MAPKIKVSKEKILDTAYKIVKRSGMEKLSASKLAKELNCSTQPIFWWYENMNDVKEAVIEKASQLFESYLKRELKDMNPYKAIGINYIKFAQDEKELFKLLYMGSKKIRENTISSDKNKPYIINVIQNEEMLTQENAERVFEELWLFCHGIATMMATDTAVFDDDKISSMLTDIYKGILLKIKEENQN